MINEHNVFGVLQKVFEQYFVQKNESNPILPEAELALLEQLLWFSANIIADSDKSRIIALDNHIDKYLGVIIHNYSKQFTQNHWKVFTWCLSVLSMGLKQTKLTSYDVFYQFICMHLEEVYM